MESLSNYRNLEYLESLTAEGLKKMLNQIKLPYQIISIYSNGGKHYAWVNLTKQIKKIGE